MKSFITVIITILLGVCNINAQSFTRNGNTFTQVNTKSDKKSFTQTEFTWKDSKGNIYPIFITSTGRCFVNKISSKTGKEYKYYLKEDIAKEICKALHITYKEK